jgi:pyruvyltransferase
MRPISLYYYQRRDGGINFGDALSPLIFEAVTGRKVVRARMPFARYAGLGSLLRRITREAWQRIIPGGGRRLKIWGTGFIEDGPQRSTFMLDVLAVRGPLSRDRLGLGPQTVLGDPGILAPMLLKSRPPKKHRWGIIPHYVDADAPEVQRLARATPHAIVIPMTIDPLESLRMIAECECIASSSLHGLIAADALGLPNWRLHFGGGITGGDYKFRDYAMGCGRAGISAVAFPADWNLELLAEKDADFDYQDTLSAQGSVLAQVLAASL